MGQRMPECSWVQSTAWPTRFDRLFESIGQQYGGESTRMGDQIRTAQVIWSRFLTRPGSGVIVGSDWALMKEEVVGMVPAFDQNYRIWRIGPAYAPTRTSSLELNPEGRGKLPEDPNEAHVQLVVKARTIPDTDVRRISADYKGLDADIDTLQRLDQGRVHDRLQRLYDIRGHRNRVRLQELSLTVATSWFDRPRTWVQTDPQLTMATYISYGGRVGIRVIRHGKPPTVEELDEESLQNYPSTDKASDKKAQAQLDKLIEFIDNAAEWDANYRGEQFHRPR